MKFSKNALELQQFLNSKNATDTPLKEDGMWGTVSSSALNVFVSKDQGPTGWEFMTDHMTIAGDDVIFTQQDVTWFGGSDDPQDNGDTASGISTKLHPEYIGCSMPMDFGDLVPNTKFAPMQKVPWLTEVQFSLLSGHSLTCKLIDVGPAMKTKHGGDLTQAAFRILSPSGSTKLGVIKNVTIRIIGGAKYAKRLA